MRKRHALVEALRIERARGILEAAKLYDRLTEENGEKDEEDQRPETEARP